LPGRGADVVDLCQPGVGHGAAGRREAPRLGYLEGRVPGLDDDPVLLGVVVEAAERGHEVFLGAAPAAGVAAITTLALTCAMSCMISVGVGSSRRRALQWSAIRFQ
jgi:hypothetical protein